MTVISLGVRELVEFISRSGHISSSFAPSSRAVEGTRLHQLIQRRQDDHYQSEVSLSMNHVFENGITLQLSGRTDGIITTENGIIIDEIKSTARELEQIETIDTYLAHLDQARVYAYIYASQHNLSTIQVRLTYIQLETEDIKYFYAAYTLEELTAFFLDLMAAYERFVFWIENGRIARDQSLKALTFPYSSYRPGQKEMARACFRAIKEQNTLFIQAATGIGKTLSTLYPALKALAQGYTSKIMYLTAKTIARQVALDTLDLLCDQGAYLRTVTITAKEKICFLEESRCDPEICPYANGHYDRVNDALYDCISHEQHWRREVIESYAKKHQVCPFEFSLDLFNFADVSVSDYNYAFDPKVNLKRAFDEKNNYTLLVDEAHNLVDRARSMFSSTLSLDILETARKSMRPKKGKLYRQLKKVTDYVKEIAVQNQNEPYIKKEMPEGLNDLLENYTNEARKQLPEMEESPIKENLLEVFFMATDMIRISEYYNKDYITYFENNELKYFCLNPAHCLIPIYQRVQSVILFSATLLPIRYFFELLGGLEKHKKLYYASPFPKENKCLLVAGDVHATYARRQGSYRNIVRYLQLLLQKKPGHYLIFFPSYAYLNAVAEMAQETLTDTAIFLQTSQMTENERESYLAAFQSEPDKKALFFCVLGGIFSEGIDLKGDQIVGVIIVSVGLPQICLERELIRQHFDHEGKGYDYAYVYPGFNKVLQGAGRLIRTMEDRGVILLLDQRYQLKSYLSLFPEEWHHAQPTSLNQIGAQLDNFYHISVEKSD